MPNRIRNRPWAEDCQEINLAGHLISSIWHTPRGIKIKPNAIRRDLADVEPYLLQLPPDKTRYELARELSPHERVYKVTDQSFGRSVITEKTKVCPRTGMAPPFLGRRWRQRSCPRNVARQSFDVIRSGATRSSYNGTLDLQPAVGVDSPGKLISVEEYGLVLASTE